MGSVAIWSITWESEADSSSSSSSSSSSPTLTLVSSLYVPGTVVSWIVEFEENSNLGSIPSKIKLKKKIVYILTF